MEKERFAAHLKELCAASVEKVRLLTEAHVKLFNGTLAKSALDSRDTCLKELEESLVEIKRSVQDELQKQMEQELEIFVKRASEQADRLAESILRAIEAKIATIQIRVVPNRTAGR